MINDPLTEAIAAHQAGQLDEARHLYAQVLAEKPTNPSLNQVMGLLELQAGQTNAAQKHFEAILATQPNAPAALRGRAQVLLAKSNPTLAETDLRQAVEAEPENAEGHALLGAALDAQDRPVEALASLEIAISYKPGDVGLLRSTARILRETGHADQALPIYQAIAAALPQDADAHAGEGAAYWELAQYEQALGAFDRALAIDSNHSHALWNRAMVLLMLERHDEGWPAYEARWQASEKPPPHADIPQWDGGPLDDRTILLGSEQGFGDVIQFIRYAPMVAARGGRVVAESWPELATLLATCDGISDVWLNTDPRPTADVQVPLASLPSVFQTTSETIPASVPYLAGPPGPTVDKGKSEQPRVGLIWSGQQMPRANRKRSMTVTDLDPIVTMEDITFISLQIGGDCEALQSIAGPAATIIDVSAKLSNFGETARFMETCDAIISIDTGAAHLAGALGRPTAVLLPFSADWRWGSSKPTTQWYPTVTLFRQQRMGDWSAPISSATEWLRDLLTR